MTAQLESLSPVVDATPGAVATGRVRVTNESASAASFTIRVVGLSTTVDVLGASDASMRSVFTVVIEPHSTVDCDVPVPIPVDIAVGQHAAAFQATSDRPEDRPMLSPFTVSVESVEKVNITVEPTPIRGRRKAKFLLGLSNDEPAPVAFTLDAEATDVRVRFKQPAFRLLPGQRAATKAKVRGPRHLVGEVIQHNLVIAARGKASATTITAPFVQRPLFAHKLRALTAGLAVIALWLAAIGGVALWVASRNDDAATQQAIEAENAALVRLVDADGNVLDNGPYMAQADGTIVDSDGNPVEGFTIDINGNVIDDKGNPINGVVIDPDTQQLVDAEGTPIGLPPPSDANGGPGGDGGDGGSGDGSDQTAGGGDGSGGDASADEPVTGIIAPTETIFRGTVAADGTDDLSDVAITLVPIDLGTEPRPDATVLDAPSQTPGQGGVPDGTNASKIWSARFAPTTRSLGPLRQTEPAPPQQAIAGVDGVWLISDVELRRTYELSFAKAGFDTQAFVISPPDDGAPVELDVILEPSTGVIAGRILDGGRPLGGVEVAISDGTLTFTTTSSTDGDVGAFSFEGVSTPGVYTLTAERDGYGTEVLQLTMDAGQQRDDVVVNMQDGVATVSGSIVNEFGTPLGGVTVTASNGDITRTTNSLTEGNRGFYSIPQLDVPGTYTITVAFDGYLPQTRRVPLSGSTGGISFALTNTTSRLAGLVSSEGGGGIVGALVTLSNADLKFEVSTAAAPQAGAFAVDDLPPGTYTVTIEHFEHETVTELIEITEGVDPPRLDVTMPIRTRGIEAGTGSLVIEVIDPGAENAEDREIRGATVTLTTTLTGVPFVSRTDPDSFTFEFNEIPVGTYTINVSAPLYNDAAPRTVSIGRSQERRTVEMLAFGAASGSMIDSITGEVITGYTVKFFEQDPAGGAEREIAPAEVNVASSSTDGSWATAPRVLPTGRYRLEVTGASGYREPTTQVLTTGLPAMQFEVELNSGEATEIPVLVADRYPDIFGRAYEPELLGAPTAPQTGTQFVAIDEPTLAATMSCNGGPQVPMVMGDEFGTTSGTDLDAFTLTRQAVDANDLIGTCQIEITADGYVTATIDMPNVAPTDGSVLPDRVVTAALVKPVDNFGGRVFWIDPRFSPAELPLPGVEIFADQAITSITPTDTSPTPPGPQPSVSRTRIETTSDANGRWAINDQIFGGARYTFREFGFQDGLIDVVIDEDRNRVITDVSGVELSGPGTDLGVEMIPPNDGSVSGEVSILTVDLPPDFVDVGLSATDPFLRTATDDQAAVECTTPDTGLCITRGTGGNFRIDQAAAGTWSVDFTPPTNHMLFGGAAAQVQQLVGPEENRNGFDTTYVELGRVDVSLFDVGVGNPTPAPINSDVRLTLTPVTGPSTTPIVACWGSGTLPGTSTPCQPRPTNNIYTFDQIPVDLTNPTATSASYRLNAVVGGYDQSTAAVTVTIQNPVPGAQNQIGSSAIPLNFFAGSKPNVRIDLLPFGKVVFDVRGEIEPCTQPVPPAPYTDCGSTSYEPLGLIPATTGGPALTVTADFVDINGNPVTVDTGLIGRSQNASGQIEVLGPEGYYRITVSHPEYDTIVLERPTPTTGGGGTGCRFCNPSPVPGVYQLENDTPPNTLAGQFTLPLRRSTVELTVLENLTGGAAVNDATYTLTRTDDSAVAHSGVITGTNTISIPDVLPRPVPYELRIVKSGHFTAVTNIVVGRSNVDIPAANPTRVVVRAPLPRNGASISGTVIAQNSLNQPVPLAPLSVSLDFNEPDISVNNTLVPNGNNGDSSEPATAGATPDVRNFAFPNVALGINTLTFDEPAGYTAEFDEDTNIAGINQIEDILTIGPTTVAGPLIYRVDDIGTVTANIVGANSDHIFPNLRVELRPPGGGAAILPTPPIPPPVHGQGEAPPVQVTFTNVPPHVDPYMLFVSDDLHADLLQPVPINVDTAGTGTQALGNFQPVADLGRIRGTVGLVNGANTGPIDANTLIEVTQGGSAVAATVERAPDNRSYYIDLPAGAYTVTMSRPPTATETDVYTEDSISVIVEVGEPIANDANLTISQTATLTITVSAFAPASLTVHAVEYDTSVSPPINVGVPIEADRSATNPNQFTVDVPPGRWRAQVVDSDIGTRFFPPNGTQVTSGTDVPIAVDIERRLEVTVNGNAGNGDRTVTVFQSGGQVAEIERGGRTFTFIEQTGAANPTDNRIPPTGPLSIVVSRNNARSLALPIDETLQPAVAVSLNEVVDVDVQLQSPAGTNLALDNAPITRTPPLSGAISNTNSSGIASFNNLSNAADGGDATYTFSADIVGEGIGSVPITIGAAAPVGDQTLNLELVPEPATLEVTVRDEATSNPIPNASVVIDSQTLVADGNGVASLQLLENQKNVAYSASATNYDPNNDTLAAFTQRGTTSVNLDLEVATVDVTFNVSNVAAGAAQPSLTFLGSTTPFVANTLTIEVPVTTATPQTWTITSPAYQDEPGTVMSFAADSTVNQAMTLKQLTGVVSNAGGVVVGATVIYCVDAGSACAAGSLTTTTGAGGVYTFTHPGAVAEDYRIEAVNGTEVDDTTFAVGANAVITPASVNLTVA